MKKHNLLNLLKEGRTGILLSILLGCLGYGLKLIIKSPIADPLLVAMTIGIIVRAMIGDTTKIGRGLSAAPMIFIPIGVVFYAAKNLNFVKFAKVDISMILLLIIIIIVYFAVTIILGRLLNQKKEITYLTATGSAICGASAIVIMAPAIDADPDDVSISVLSVAAIAFFGLFILLPFLATAFGITNAVYGLLAGSVLQFTGFVKAAVGNVPLLAEEVSSDTLTSMALSTKAVRFIGLLIAIPLFGSMAKKKFHIPWFLWTFLGAGIIGTLIYAADNTFHTKTFVPLIKPIYLISWSIAMAAVGLNANVRQLLSNNGTKALIMAFTGFCAAVAAFFIGIFVINSF